MVQMRDELFSKHEVTIPAVITQQRDLNLALTLLPALTAFLPLTPHVGEVIKLARQGNLPRNSSVLCDCLRLLGPHRPQLQDTSQDTYSRLMLPEEWWNSSQVEPILHGVGRARAWLMRNEYPTLPAGCFPRPLMHSLGFQDCLARCVVDG
jgi:hypothetical protein